MSVTIDRGQCSRCRRGMTDEEIESGRRTCDKCHMDLLRKRRSGYCIYCGAPGLDPEDLVGNGVCPDCREKRGTAVAIHRMARGGLSNIWRRASVRCPLCGEKALFPIDPNWQCGRCGFSLTPVPKHTVVAPTGRLTREQQHGAHRCPACGKKRLLAASARRYECHGCGQCYLKSTEPDPDFVRPRPVEDDHDGLMETYDGRWITPEQWRAELKARCDAAR